MNKQCPCCKKSINLKLTVMLKTLFKSIIVCSHCNQTIYDLNKESFFKYFVFLFVTSGILINEVASLSFLQKVLIQLLMLYWLTTFLIIEIIFKKFKCKNSNSVENCMESIYVIQNESKKKFIKIILISFLSIFFLSFYYIYFQTSPKIVLFLGVLGFSLSLLSIKLWFYRDIQLSEDSFCFKNLPFKNKCKNFTEIEKITTNESSIVIHIIEKEKEVILRKEYVSSDLDYFINFLENKGIDFK
jgi:hypothetical protein